MATSQKFGGQLDGGEAQYFHELSGCVFDCTAKSKVQKDLY